MGRMKEGRKEEAGKTAVFTSVEFSDDAIHLPVGRLAGPDWDRARARPNQRDRKTIKRRENEGFSL